MNHDTDKHAECTRRGWHLIRSGSNRIATCSDCGCTGDLKWGQLNLSREGTALLRVGRAVEKLAKQEGICA